MLFVQTNMAFPIERDAELVAHVIGRFQPDVATFVEARHRNGAALPLAPLMPGYRVTQDVGNGWRSGCAIAVAEGRVALRRALPLMIASRAARGRTRVGIRVWRENVVETGLGPVHVIVSHAPTRSTGAQNRWMRRIRRRTRRLTAQGRLWIVIGDFNQPYERMARFIEGRGYGHGIDGFVLSPRLARNVSCTVKVDRAAKRARLTDHPVVALYTTL